MKRFDFDDIIGFFLKTAYFLMSAGFLILAFLFFMFSICIAWEVVSKC